MYKLQKKNNFWLSKIVSRLELKVRTVLLLLLEKPSTYEGYKKLIKAEF